MLQRLGQRLGERRSHEGVHNAHQQRAENHQRMSFPVLGQRCFVIDGPLDREPAHKRQKEQLGNTKEDPCAAGEYVHDEEQSTEQDQGYPAVEFAQKHQAGAYGRVFQMLVDPCVAPLENTKKRVDFGVPPDFFTNEVSAAKESDASQYDLEHGFRRDE